MSTSIVVHNESLRVSYKQHAMYIIAVFALRLAWLVVISFAQFCGLLQRSNCLMLLLFFKRQQCLLCSQSHNISCNISAWLY